MKGTKNSKPASSGWRACVAALAIFIAAAGQARAERLTATLVNPGGHPSTLPVEIHIDGYSTDAEVQQLFGVLAKKGPDGLRDALWDLEKGYIRIGGSLGYPIAVVVSKPADGGRDIRIMMDRPLSIRELATNARSLDYPFGYIEIKLDKDGKGEGQMFAAARISETAGILDVENYSFLPLKLLSVRAH
jgi:hypothetical protein